MGQRSSIDFERTLRLVVVLAHSLSGAQSYRLLGCLVAVLLVEFLEIASSVTPHLVCSKEYSEAFELATLEAELAMDCVRLSVLVHETCFVM